MWEEARRMRPSPPRSPQENRIACGSLAGAEGRFGEMALYRSPRDGRNGHNIISSINEDNGNNEAGGELVSMESRVRLQIMGVHKFSCVCSGKSPVGRSELV